MVDVIETFNNYARNNALFILGGALSGFLWTYYGPKILGKGNSKKYSTMFHSAMLGVGIYGLYLNMAYPKQQPSY